MLHINIRNGKQFDYYASLSAAIVTSFMRVFPYLFQGYLFLLISRNSILKTWQKMFEEKNIDRKFSAKRSSNNSSFVQFIKLDAKLTLIRSKNEYFLMGF